MRAVGLEHEEDFVGVADDYDGLFLLMRGRAGLRRWVVSWELFVAGRNPFRRVSNRDGRGVRAQVLLPRATQRVD